MRQCSLDQEEISQQIKECLLVAYGDFPAAENANINFWLTRLAEALIERERWDANENIQKMEAP